MIKSCLTSQILRDGVCQGQSCWRQRLVRLIGRVEVSSQRLHDWRGVTHPARFQGSITNFARLPTAFSSWIWTTNPKRSFIKVTKSPQRGERKICGTQNGTHEPCISGRINCATALCYDGACKMGQKNKTWFFLMRYQTFSSHVCISSA